MPSNIRAGVKEPDTESDSSAALSNADSGRGSNEDNNDSTDQHHLSQSTGV